MIIHSSDIKEVARDSLKGHWFAAIFAAFLSFISGVFLMSFQAWGRFALLMAAYVWFMESLPGFTPMILGICCGLTVLRFFIGGAVRLGYIRFNLSLLDREKAGIGQLFSCISLFWKALYLRVFLSFLCFCCSLLLFLPGLIIYYTYAMAPYVLEERKEFPVIEAMRASRKMMRGNRFRLFKLQLSFLGWDLLCLVTFGLACVYVVPLKYCSEAVFYNEISGRADVYYAREE